jgi:hypothetical protein
MDVRVIKKEGGMSKNLTVGRPKKLSFTKEDLDEIEHMAGIGLNLEQIAAIYGRSHRTFQKYFKEMPELHAAIERGRANTNKKVTNVAYQMAISGQHPSMTMFWLKCRARWKETVTTEHKLSDSLESIVAASYGKKKNDSSTE